MTALRKKLDALYRHIGDRPVTLVAVTKYTTVDRMREAYAAGVRHFGENRVQEALAKMAAFPPEDYPDLHWHLIGSLQTNKVNKTLGRFALIHSVDSVRLAQKLSAANAAAGLTQAILLQVNSRPEADRHGFSPQEVPAAAPAIAELPGLRLRGLMTMAPPAEDPEVLRRVFCGLRDMRTALKAKPGIDLPDLSMGMSHDYVHALKCSATIIRIGSYLFRD